MRTRHNAHAIVRGVHFLPTYYKRAFLLLLYIPLLLLVSNAQSQSMLKTKHRPNASKLESRVSHKLRAVVLYNAAQGKGDVVNLASQLASTAVVNANGCGMS